MTNSRNERVQLSASDKMAIGFGFVSLIGSVVASTAIIVSIFYSTTGEIQRANAVQDIRLDAHDAEIARLRGK